MLRKIVYNASGNWIKLSRPYRNWLYTNGFTSDPDNWRDVATRQNPIFICCVEEVNKKLASKRTALELIENHKQTCFKLHETAKELYALEEQHCVKTEVVVSVNSSHTNIFGQKDSAATVVTTRQVCHHTSINLKFYWEDKTVVYRDGFGELMADFEDNCIPHQYLVAIEQDTQVFTIDMVQCFSRFHNALRTCADSYFQLVYFLKANNFKLDFYKATWLNCLMSKFPNSFNTPNLEYKWFREYKEFAYEISLESLCNETILINAFTNPIAGSVLEQEMETDLRIFIYDDENQLVDIIYDESVGHEIPVVKYYIRKKVLWEAAKSRNKTVVKTLIEKYQLINTSFYKESTIDFYLYKRDFISIFRYLYELAKACSLTILP